MFLSFVLCLQGMFPRKLEVLTCTAMLNMGHESSRVFLIIVYCPYRLDIHGFSYVFSNINKIGLAIMTIIFSVASLSRVENIS